MSTQKQYSSTRPVNFELWQKRTEFLTKEKYSLTKKLKSMVVHTSTYQ